MESPKNAFEVFFLDAVTDPAKAAEFYAWVGRQVFFVPCQEMMRPAAQPRSRRVDLDAATRIQLRAFVQGDQAIIPFFSDLSRFEAWSAPDPESQYIEVTGRMLFGLVKKGSAALLNPNSERFSKWFESSEVDLVLKAQP